MKIQRHFKLNCKNIYLDNLLMQPIAGREEEKFQTSFLEVYVALSSKKERPLWGKSLQ